MSDYIDQQNIARRGVILAHMMGSDGQPVNADILLAVVKGCGIPSYYPEIVQATSWLEEKGYAKISGNSDIVIAEITPRGKRLTRKEIQDDGVKLPEIGL